MCLSNGSASSKNSDLNADENDLSLIDLRSIISNTYDRTRPTSVRSDHVTVQKVRKIHSADSSNSSIKKLTDDDSIAPQQRINSGGSVQVTRVKSSTIKPSIINDNQNKDTSVSNAESANVVRVTYVPGAPTSSSSELPRPSIIDNTIHLDETSETISSADSSKKKQRKVRVKHVTSTHRDSAIEARPSQIDTIQLSSAVNDSISKKTLPPVRVGRVRTDRNKIKSPKSIVPFESIVEETIDERPEIGRAHV